MKISKVLSDNSTFDESQLSQLSEQLETALVSNIDSSDGSHDLYHARRVWENAKKIASIEGNGNLKLLCAGAYLHDLISLPKNSRERSNSSSLSAEASEPILESLGLHASEIEAIKHMIISHSYSANTRPETVEARILQDSDRLEALGAIGIARVFYTAGKLGSKLFDGNDPFAQQRNLDDKLFALDHFKVKLLNIAETMQTEAGKQVAAVRAQVINRFINSIGEELSHSNSW